MSSVCLKEMMLMWYIRTIANVFLYSTISFPPEDKQTHRSDTSVYIPYQSFALTYRCLDLKFQLKNLLVHGWDLNP